MSFPKQSAIELPLLKTLQELGGKAEPKELYPRLAALFSQLTQEDLTARTPSNPSIFRWHNLVQWSRQKLVEKGENRWLDAWCVEVDAERPSACDRRDGEFLRGTAAGASSDIEGFGLRKRG